MLTNFAGEWKGTKRLYFEGADGPMLESTSALTAQIVIGQFLQVHYHWEYDSKAQEGLLLAGDDAEAGVATVSWVDTFHQSKRVMFCQGTATESGVSVFGSYEAGEGPAWGWRIDLELVDQKLKLTMYNLSPEGEGYLAVAGEYQRTT